MTETLRILIVEDSENDAGLARHEIATALERCEFRQVSDRCGYLEALASFRPDLIITDYSMPQFDGMAALQLALAFAPQTPVIVWTGSINEDIAVQCMKAGANNYVLKDNIKRLGPAAVHALDEQKVLNEKRQADEQIKRALIEKETLLRELYHRTKNNMSVIIALLDLQLAETGDERLRAAFADMQNRIRSMALVHQKLYEAGDLSRINLKEYAADLLALLTASYRISPAKVQVTMAMGDVFVSIDTAIPCGLVLNELISNAFKHAFPAERTGKICLHLAQTQEGYIELQVADDGVGFPVGFDSRRDGRLGLQTVFALAESQLEGQVRFTSQHGVHCAIAFQNDSGKPRV
ncbi:MAG: histidine kinase dimerization/phosphoacceptor domain -containing protein [Chloroflexota bacterium]